MNNDQPVTRAELTLVLSDFKRDFKEELKAELVPELTAVMRDIETNMLTAFHGYTRSNSVRLNAMDVTDRELRVRMDVLENRVVALEIQRPPVA